MRLSFGAMIQTHTSGLPDNKLGIDQNLLGNALALQPAEKRLRGNLCHFLPRLADGGETGVLVGSATHVIEADGWVLGFALLLPLAATISFGLAPALLTTASNMQSNFKESAARSGSSGGRQRVRRFLAAAEIGLAAVLVVAAGLLARSLFTMTSVNPGINVAHILKAEISLPRYQSTPQQWTAFSNALLERIQAQPGLQDSALLFPYRWPTISSS